MSLNLYNIFEEIILESVDINQVVASIKEPFRVKILYQGEGETSPQWRFIDPYVVGNSKAGNLIVRGFQTFGFTTTRNPEWKTFRLDRILRWEPTKYRLGNKPIDAYDPTIAKYKTDGSDLSMIGNTIAHREFNQPSQINKTNSYGKTGTGTTPSRYE